MKTIEQQIEIYNRLHNDKNVKLFLEALPAVIKEKETRKPNRVYYKSSNIYDYYIEEPYETLTHTSKGVEYEKHYYNAIYVKKGKDVTNYCGNFCLSLCKYTRDEIIKSIEQHIEDDLEDDKND